MLQSQNVTCVHWHAAAAAAAAAGPFVLDGAAASSRSQGVCRPHQVLYHPAAHPLSHQMPPLRQQLPLLLPSCRLAGWLLPWQGWLSPTGHSLLLMPLLSTCQLQHLHLQVMLQQTTLLLLGKQQALVVVLGPGQGV